MLNVLIVVSGVWTISLEEIAVKRLTKTEVGFYLAQPQFHQYFTYSACYPHPNIISLVM